MFADHITRQVYANIAEFCCIGDIYYSRLMIYYIIEYVYQIIGIVKDLMVSQVFNPSK